MSLCYHLYAGISTHLHKFTKNSRRRPTPFGRFSASPAGRKCMLTVWPPVRPCGPHSRACPGGRTYSSYTPPHGMYHPVGDPADFNCSGRVDLPGIKVLPAAKRLEWRRTSLQSGLQFGLAVLIAGLAQEGEHILLIRRPTGCTIPWGTPRISTARAEWICPASRFCLRQNAWSGGVQAYSLASSSALRSSYPGLPRRANIFFLYASTPGWSKGFTPSR